MYVIKNIDNDEISKYNNIAIDTEWTKNYKIKNGNKPFNFSIIFFNNDIKIYNIKKQVLSFKFISLYIENENEIPNLINILNSYIVFDNFKLLIGHQVISDLYTFIYYSKHYTNIDVSNIQKWLDHFKDRINNHKIFDTRFDIKNWLNNPSRRLVDICYEMKIKKQKDLYKQPELKKSMTAMHNEYINGHNDLIRQKLSVLNLRHNLSTLLVYQLYLNKIKLNKYININKILYKNLKNYFSYIKSEEFCQLMNMQHKLLKYQKKIVLKI